MVGSVAVSIHKNYQLDAILDIFRTLFVCAILAIGALLISKDTSDLVLTPIERMLAKINSIAENPLEAAYREEEKNAIMENAEDIKKKKKKSKKKEEFQIETKVLVMAH